MVPSTTANEVPAVPYRKAISCSEKPASARVWSKTISTATNSSPVTASWPKLSSTSEAGYCQAALAHMPHSAR